MQRIEGARKCHQREHDGEEARELVDSENREFLPEDRQGEGGSVGQRQSEPERDERQREQSSRAREAAEERKGEAAEDQDQGRRNEKASRHSVCPAA